MANKKILLVDDEISFTRAVKMNLEADGDYEVKIVNEGTMALEVARAFMPNLIFLDLVMSDIEGSELARHLRADQQLKRIPIVFLTATITREEVSSHGGVVGGETFLPKPVTVEELIRCIEQKAA